MHLTDEQRMIMETARDFARERLAPGAGERDRTAAFPAAELAEMGTLGFMGMLTPEDWGGSDTGMIAHALAMEEIAAGDGAVSTIMSVHNGVGQKPIADFGSDTLKEQYLRPLAEGKMLGAFALSEPEAGSDAGAIRTRAVRDGNHFVLNGTKQFITSGKYCDVAVVFAVTDPDAGRKGISAFVVPSDTQGYEVTGIDLR